MEEYTDISLLAPVRGIKTSSNCGSVVVEAESPVDDRTNALINRYYQGENVVINGTLYMHEPSAYGPPKEGVSHSWSNTCG